ncbi:ABC transporter substrate-binding protein [Nocardioides sp.]|uniref:ABC transporter substrate-binding protein n=1 Tax=Nocardioides sp. TaxID=35761 RepID=UPI003561C386
MKQQPLLALSTAIALTFTLAACGGSRSNAETAPEAREITHAMGATDVTCTPERVVTLGQGETDSTLALGVTPVGVVSPWTDDWYDYLPDEVEEAEVVGTEVEPDLEAIAALEPDLILGSKLRHEGLYEQLSQIAPTVFTETIGVSWKENVGTYAEALCREDRGDELVEEYEARAAAIGEDLRAADQADTEVSIVRFLPDQVRIYLTGFPGSVIRDTGLPRPKAQRVADWEDAEQLVEISEERIPEMDGDVIFEMISADHYAQQGTSTVDEQIERWTSTDLWKNLSAVRAGTVVEVDESVWNLGGGLGAAHAMLEDLEQYFANA